VAVERVAADPVAAAASADINIKYFPQVKSAGSLFNDYDRS
jgi:hypothetical protein